MSIAEHLENTDKQKVKKKKFKYPVTSVSEIVFWYIPSQFIFLYIYFPVYSYPPLKKWKMRLRKMKLYDNGISPLQFFVPKEHNPSQITRKISDKFQMRDILQNIWPLILKTFKIIIKKESLRICHNKKSLWRHDDGVTWSPDGIFEQEKNIRRKLGKSG